jgi:hypothetical protein
MDKLQQSGQEKRRIVMGDFPLDLPLTTSVSSDYNALSPLYTRAKQEAACLSNSSSLFEQLHRLEDHVKSCHAIWNLVRSKRLPQDVDIPSEYRAKMSGQAGCGKASPRRILESPSKNERRRRKATEDGDTLVMLSQTRALATLWRDALTVTDVPALCHFGDEASLQRLKVAFGAETDRRTRQRFV